MEDLTSPSVETEGTVTESLSEENQDTQPSAEEATSPDAALQQEEGSSDEQPVQNRSQERIREVIEARKRAEAEAQYWKNQATRANQAQTRPTTSPTDLSDIIGEDGTINPADLVKKMERMVEDRLQQNLQTFQTQQQRQMEEMQVSQMKEMQDPVFRRYVVNMARAENISPLEAYEIGLEEMKQGQQPSQAQQRARDEAGRFVRESTTTPATGRGSSSVEPSFTREQLASMTSEEYARNRAKIEDQLARGLIS
jgi:hypothetical protein